MENCAYLEVLYAGFSERFLFAQEFGKLDLGILFLCFAPLMKVCAVGQVVSKNDQFVFGGPVKFVRSCDRSQVTAVTRTKK